MPYCGFTKPHLSALIDSLGFSTTLVTLYMLMYKGKTLSQKICAYLHKSRESVKNNAIHLPLVCSINFFFFWKVQLQKSKQLSKNFSLR